MVYFRFIVIVIIFLAYHINAEAQYVTFTAKDSKNQKEIKLDSIKIHNITKNRDTVLIGIQSIDLSLISDVKEQSNCNLKSLLISQNYPNEFNNETRFNVYTPSSTNLKLSLIDLLGNKYTESYFYIEPGSQTFILSGSGLNNGIYFLSVQTKNETKCVKIIKTGNSDKKDVYFKLVNNSNVVSNKINKTFITQADIFKFIGYSKTFRQSIMNEITPVDSQNYEFEMIQYEPNIKYNSGIITIRNFWSKEIYEETKTDDRFDSILYVKKDTTIKFLDSVLVDMKKRIVVELDSFSLPSSRCDSSIFYNDSLVFCLENVGSYYIGDVTYSWSNYTHCSIYIDTLINTLSFYLYEYNSDSYMNGMDASSKSKDYILNVENISYIIDSSNTLIAKLEGSELTSAITKFVIYGIERVTRISEWTTVHKINIFDGINKADDKSILILKLYP